MDSCTSDPDLPDAGGGACCIGAAVYGPGRCTCWDAVHQPPEQAPPQTDVQPTTRATMCRTCAFRPGSPELTGHPKAAHDADTVLGLGMPDAPTFWCHDGMRLTVALVHPTGVRVELTDELAWDPPHVDCVPYRADGRPALRCAGQALAQRRFLADPGSYEDALRSASERIDARRAALLSTAQPVSTCADLSTDAP